MNDGRDTAGKFVKGNAGGPGRPKGLGSRPTFASRVGEEAIARLAQKVLTLGEAIQVEAPDWKEWSTEELTELRAVAARIAQKLACAKG